MKLEGNLSQFPLRELLEMVSYSSVTGALNLYHNEANANLYFRNGHLSHVVCGKLNGFDALVELFTFDDAHFSFVSDVAVEEETVWGDAHSQINNAERQSVRVRQVRSRISSLATVPVLTGARERLLSRVLPSDYPVFHAIDGSSAIEALYHAIGWTPLDICDALIRLIDDNVVTLQQASGAEASSSITPSVAKGRAGLFEKIVTRATNSIAPMTSVAELAPATVSARPSNEDLILRMLRS